VRISTLHEPASFFARGITVSYESVRYWCRKFGPGFARRLRNREGRLADVWHLDELFVTIWGERFYLWRAVDQDGDTLDILVQKRRDRQAAKRFFRKLLKGQGRGPNRLSDPSSVHDAVQNLFRVGRHLLRSSHHRLLRDWAFDRWREVTSVH
jgi:putative transposase